MIGCDLVEWPECQKCGEEYHPRRKELGYKVCLNCGDVEAKKSIDHKRKCTAPLFNKGAYQYVGNLEAAKWIGR